jgi:hypothetical protein
MGAEGSHAKAEAHYKRGKQLYDMGDYDDAVKEYKEASNWFFKGGERRLSDDAKNWARRARVRDIEKRVEDTTDMRRECHCVCEWVRLFNIFKEATIRTASVQLDWKPQRPTELELRSGDVLTVLGRDENETAADPNIIWYRGILEAKVPQDDPVPTSGSPVQATVREPLVQGVPKGSAKLMSSSSSRVLTSGGASPLSKVSTPDAAAKPAKQERREGLFPTRQLMCTDRGKPLYDDVRRASLRVGVPL